MTRQIILVLDEEDDQTIQSEIARRQAASRRIDPASPTILPSGQSNLIGAIFAECVRDLEDYRYYWESD